MRKKQPRYKKDRQENLGVGTISYKTKNTPFVVSNNTIEAHISWNGTKIDRSKVYPCVVLVACSWSVVFSFSLFESFFFLVFWFVSLS
jgi:hypothetical protein